MQFHLIINLIHYLRRVKTLLNLLLYCTPLIICLYIYFTNIYHKS